MNAKTMCVGFLTATVVLAPVGTLKPASAIEYSNNQLMAQADLDPATRARARTQAMQSQSYREIQQKLLSQSQRLQQLKRYDPRRAIVANDIRRLQRQLEEIITQHEAGYRALGTRQPSQMQPRPAGQAPPRQSFETAPSRPGSSHSNQNNH